MIKLISGFPNIGGKISFILYTSGGTKGSQASEETVGSLMLHRLLLREHT